MAGSMEEEEGVWGRKKESNQAGVGSKRGTDKKLSSPSYVLWVTLWTSYVHPLERDHLFYLPIFFPPLMRDEGKEKA